MPRTEPSELPAPANTTGAVLKTYRERGASPIDRRWGLEVKRPGDAWEAIPFNTHMAWRYQGELQADCLQRAVEKMVDRHPVLSCTLRFSDGGWRFTDVSRHCATVVRLESPGPDAVESARQRLGEFVFREFDLEQEGPLRVGFSEAGERDFVIAVAIHHAFTDRYSSRLFAAELASLYEALVRNQQPRLPEVRLSFLDYLHSIAEWSTSTHAQLCLQYWQDYLEGARLTPYARTDKLLGGAFRLPEALSDRVRELCSAEEVGVRMYWETVHHVTLHRLLGDEDVTTLSVDFGRRQAELATIVGQLVNLLPCRSRILENSTCRELLLQMHRGSRKSAPYRQTPYDLIDQRCRTSLASSIGHLNFIPAKFAHLPAFGQLFGLAIPHGVRGRFIYPYAISVSEDRGFSISCGGHICQPFTAAELRSMLERVAICLVTSPDCEISKLDI